MDYSLDPVLNRICHIKGHPISKLDDTYKTIYLKGLGASLCCLDAHNQVCRLLFDVLARNISPTIKTGECWKNDPSSIKKAISLQRNGFKFFYMKDYMLYECFQLLKESNTSKSDKELYDKALRFFEKEICGIFSKGTARRTYDAFKSNNTNKLPIGNALLQNMRENAANIRPAKRVLVVANVSAGKSTLINALTGYPISEARTTACTSQLIFIENKLAEDGMTTCQGDHYSYYTEDEMGRTNSSSFHKAALHFHSELNTERICLIDTPGINNAEDQQHRKTTENAIKGNAYDAVLYVANCQYFGTNDERRLLEELKRNTRKPVLFVLNQLDKFKQKEDSVEKMMKGYSSFLNAIGFKQPTIVPTSAMAALLFKQPQERLDEDDAFEKELLEKKFGKDFFCLPKYTKQNPGGEGLLYRTGITTLEKELKTLIKQTNI